MNFSVHISKDNMEKVGDLDRIAHYFGLSRSQLVQEGIDLVLARYNQKMWLESMESCSQSLEQPLDFERTKDFAR